MNRRSFLEIASLAAGSAAAGSLLNRPLSASRLGFGLQRATGDDKILVVVQLSGGNDGLNTVVPIANAAYAQARGRLALPRKDLHVLRKDFGLHPALRGLAQMYAKGKLAIVHGCGYPKPNRSHFKSMDIWHAADPSGRDLRYGWLGRALDRIEGGAADLAVNISTKSPLALNGERYKPISFRDPATYRYSATEPVMDAFEKLAFTQAEKQRNPILASVRRSAEEALATSRSIRQKALAYKTPQAYPRQGLGAALKNIAGLIAGGLETRVYYSYHGSFDTHANQVGRRANLLRQLDQALLAFQKDLERLGVADRVCVVLFSEFGRRVKANASGGTDHGVAGPMLLLGSGVNAGLHGEHPSLSDLDKGDLRHTTDFRQVYATLLEDWLQLDAKPVLRAEFKKLDLFA